jgi:hypothetical protein
MWADSSKSGPPFLRRPKVEKPVKMSQNKRYRKKPKFKARESRGVRRTDLRRSDFEMKRNAEAWTFLRSRQG